MIMSRRIAIMLLSLAFLGAGVGRGQGAEPEWSNVAPGWSRSSINTVIFRHSPVVTAGNLQYTAFYDGNQHVVLARRTLGSAAWEINTTELTGNATDAHNTISLGADGRGIIHLAWNHHGDNLHYVRTSAPGSLQLTPEQKTDGVRENSVTYPEFYSMPGGDLLLLYRVGSSGNGDLLLKRYDVQTGAWSTVQQNLLAGEGKQNAYWEMCVDGRGTIHLGWVWRRTPNVETNHDICYARSTDGGKHWTDSTGKPLTMPVTAETCEVALHVPEKSDLINQTSIAADADGRPCIATFFKPAGQTVTQLMVVYHDGKVWKTSQVGTRTTALNLGGGGTKRLLLSRPLMLGRTVAGRAQWNVVFRDVDRGDRISIATCDDLAEDRWQIRDLTTESYGSWEPTYDPVRWQREGVVNLFVQNTDQVDGGDRAVRRDGPAPTMVSILEWKPQ
jgi:hypothetical protein